MERYIYRSLKQGPNNIRLLRLLPGLPTDSVWCEIIHYALDTGRAYGLYEALSYVWGESVMRQSILVIDAQSPQIRHLDITSNLYAALQQLRDPDLPRILWIDAVCTLREFTTRDGLLTETCFCLQVSIRTISTSVHRKSRSCPGSRPMQHTSWCGDGEEVDHSSDTLDLISAAAKLSPYRQDWEWFDRIGERKPSVEALLCRPWFGRIWVSSNW